MLLCEHRFERARRRREPALGVVPVQDGGGDTGGCRERLVRLLGLGRVDDYLDAEYAAALGAARAVLVLRASEERVGVERTGALARINRALSTSARLRSGCSRERAPRLQTFPWATWFQRRRRSWRVG